MEKDLTIPYILYKTGPFDTVTHPEIIECFQENETMLQCKTEYSNDGDCYNFINEHFDENVVKAYDMLIPGAYKADLWRLCVLYIHGGIYGDLTQTFLREYDVNKDDADIILIRDWHNNGIYNAFIAAKKHNSFIKYCIEKIAQQILMRNRGRGCLDITGPSALRRHYFKFFNISEINLGLQELTGIDNKIYTINVPFHYALMCENHPNNCCDELNHGCIFLRKIKNHVELLYNNRKIIHYGQLYNENKIFKLDEKEARRRHRLRNLRVRKRHSQYNMLNMRARRHMLPGGVLRRRLTMKRIYRERFMIMR